MRKSDKITILLYIILGISMLSVYYYYDLLLERPNIDINLPTEPIKEITFVNIYTSRTIEQMFDVLTDVENYPIVLPKNIISVKIVNQTENVIIAEEEFIEKGIKSKLLVKHSFFSPDKHEIKILDGDAKDTTIIQNFETIPNGIKISTAVDLNLKGILSIIGYLPKSNLQHAADTVMEGFAIYAKTKYCQIILYGECQVDSDKLEVDRLYRETLKRPADHEGSKYYSELLKKGYTIEQIKELLLHSNEFSSSLTSDNSKLLQNLKVESKEIINDLYIEILGRAADEQGLRYYATMLEDNKLTIDEIKEQLKKSDEYLQ